MKKIICLVFVLAICAICYSQKDTIIIIAKDTSNPKTDADCCVENIAGSLSTNNEGFVTDQRLDETGKSFLTDVLNSASKFTNDYSGSLRAPGILFNAIDLSSYDLLSANLSFSDQNQVQKIVFAPFKLNPDIINTYLQNFRINLAQSSGIITVGVGIGAQYPSPQKEALLRNEIFNKGKYCIPSCFPANKQDSVKTRNKTEADNLLYEYDIMRTRHVFKWTIGYNIQLFSILSSKSGDPSVDSTNHYAIKSHNITASASYSINNGSWLFGAAYNYIIARKAADETQKTIPYNGYQFNISKRVIPLLRGEKLKTNVNFIKSVFQPSINLGLAYEYKKAKGDLKYAQDNIATAKAFTPYIDFLVSPASQFRLGVPFTNNKTVITGKGTQVGAVLQYTFKLVNLN